MSIYVVALLGALINRVRGGWATDIVRTKPKLKSFLEKIGLYGYKDKSDPKGKLYYVKDFNDLVFAYCFTFWMPLSWDTLACYLCIFAGMRGGRSFGWGGYIEAITNKEINHDRDDILLFDKWFRGNDEPILSGWAAVTLRGVIWTSFIYFGFYLASFFGYQAVSPYLCLLGLSMGTVYLITITIFDHMKVKGSGWGWGEIIFGAILWGGCALVVF